MGLVEPKTPRRYDRATRDAQIAQSRSRVIDAADAAFLDCGYAGASISQIARTAGVSIQTVYNVVGGKAELLKAAYDVRLAGDDEPVPMADRERVRSMIAAPDVRSCLHEYAALGRELGERTVPFLARLLPEASADEGLRTFTETIEAERAIGAQNVARHVHDRFGLRPGLSVDAAADILWALTSPELADRLVNRRSWGWDRFQEWLAEAMTGALAAGDGAQPRSE